jgi:hypothetical protein
MAVISSNMGKNELVDLLYTWSLEVLGMDFDLRIALYFVLHKALKV